MLDVPDWPGHRAGQHLDVRLTAEDGYQAERAYSIASAPGRAGRDHRRAARRRRGLAVPDRRAARPGDELELRGPIGGYFVWEAEDGGPLLLVGRRLGRRAAAGDAAAPRPDRQRRAGPAAVLLAHARGRDLPRPSSTSRADGVEVVHTLTRRQPPGWTGYARRVDRRCWPRSPGRPDESPLAYVCGPTSFVEAVAGGLVELGYPPERVKTERFGATGGG